jgi:hypothetical protein
MLWNTCNKLTIEGNVIGHPTDVLFTLSIHMQSWRVLVRHRDRDLLDEALGELRRLYVRMKTEGTCCYHVACFFLLWTAYEALV